MNGDGVIDIEILQSNDCARAWEVLKERIGNQQLIIEFNILGLQMISKTKKFQNLHSLVNECSRSVDNLVKTRPLNNQTIEQLWKAAINQFELEDSFIKD